MKHIIILLILVAFIPILSSVTADQILAGRNVIAYTLNGSLYLMDIDSGKDVLVPTATGSTELAWDKSGQRLYRLDAEVSTDQPTINFTFWQIDLPSLRETQVADEEAVNNNYDGMAINVGIDGMVYLAGVKHGFSRAGTAVEVRHDIVGVYDPAAISYKGVTNYAGNPQYFNPYHSSPVSRRTASISNQQVTESGFTHFELFMHPENSLGTDYQRLTYFGDPIPEVNLYNRQIDFSWSPDMSRLIYSYHYYVNDETEQFDLTNAIGADGKNQVYLTSPTGVSDAHAFVWAPDGRLIFSRGGPSPQSVQKLSVLGTDWQIKDLKTLGAEKYPAIYFRY